VDDPSAGGLKVRGLHHEYRSPGQTLQILRGLDLELRAGESVAIVGRSGAGKSTLLHLIGLLDIPTQGSIEIEGVEVVHASRSMRDRIRRDAIGFVFQFYHLLPELTALQNVLVPGMIGCSILRWLARRRAEIERGRHLLERVGLKDRVHHLPGRLSGGERQRVAIARALFRSPRLLLCDEPTGNLDEHTSADVEDLLLELHREHHSMMVLVTHNFRLAARLDRVLRLEGGVLHPKLGPEQPLLAAGQFLP